jgi:hypothetical protein
MPTYKEIETNGNRRVFIEAADADNLEAIADWLDSEQSHADDTGRWAGETEVQDDLRRIARGLRCILSNDVVVRPKGSE